MTDDKAADRETRIIRGPTQEEIEIPAVLPVLPVRDAVVYPGVTVPLAIGRPRSLAALQEASGHGFLLVVTQRDPSIEDPEPEDLHRVGCIVRVMRVIDSRREGKQALVVGIARAEVGETVTLEQRAPDAPDPPARAPHQLRRGRGHLAAGDRDGAAA